MCRYGDIVFCSYYAQGGPYPAVGNWAGLTDTMPAGYRPYINEHIIGSNPSDAVVISVAHDGSMVYFNWSKATTSSLVFTAIWYTTDPWPA